MAARVEAEVVPQRRSTSRLLGANRAFFAALARAFGGALVFGLPLLMTMEMWWLGFVVPPERLALFLVVGFPLLWGLAWMSGFREAVTWGDALVDAGVAYLVGLLASAAMLALVAAVGPGMSLYEIVGKVALQAVPAGMGATLARSQLGAVEDEDSTEPRRESYPGELFQMAAGALFLAFNVAPTEEVMLIAHQQTSPWYGLTLIAGSLLVMHAFVYAVGFRGQHDPAPHRTPWLEFVLLTVPGYAIVLLVALYTLWTFGRLDGVPAHHALHLVLVLGFPGAVGAASARLVL